MSNAQRYEQIFEGQWRPECVICKESVKLEESKANEYGQAIHEECYLWRIKEETSPLPAAVGFTPEAQESEWVVRFPLRMDRLVRPRTRKSTWRSAQDVAVAASRLLFRFLGRE
jgi:hypothetical protein